jgi:hypothetical protein
MSQSSTPGAATTSLLSNNTYNVLKHVAMYGLPLVAALYYALAQIWHFPDVTEVMASIAAVNAVLGGTLGYSTATYNASEAKYAGVIQLVEGDAKDIAQLVLNDDAHNVLSKAEALFRIERKSIPAAITSNVPKSGTVTGTAHGASL